MDVNMEEVASQAASTYVEDATSKVFMLSWLRFMALKTPATLSQLVCNIHQAPNFFTLRIGFVYKGLRADRVEEFKTLLIEIR